MLMGLAAIALVALGVLIAWLLTHRDNSHTQTGTTVFITTAATTAASTTPSVAPSAGKVVPDLKGLTLAEAQARLSALGLHVTTTPVTVAGKTAGTVVDQAPKPGGKLAKGSAVTLSVVGAAPTTTAATTTTATTTSSETTTAPTTTVAQPQSAHRSGRARPEQEASAVQALSQAGILASLAFIPGSDPLGTVVAQAESSPATTVPYHSHVQINVSRGPSDNPSVQVPNAVGQTLQAAVSTVQRRAPPADLRQVPGHVTSAGGEDRAAVAALGRRPRRRTPRSSSSSAPTGRTASRGGLGGRALLGTPRCQTPAPALPAAALEQLGSGRATASRCRPSPRRGPAETRASTSASM